VVPKSSDHKSVRARSFVAVVGHGPLLERDDGAASTLRQLGATVRTLDLWDDPINLFAEDDPDDEGRPRALLFEALDRPDLAIAALRAVRKESTFDNVGAIVSVTVGQMARIEPSSGFDDFVLHPYVPEELYARIRAVEWRKSEFATGHGVPDQRFYNVLCIAYGADRDLFGDFVRKGLLPRQRAPSCETEYQQIRYAYQQLIAPHVDVELQRQVQARQWLKPDDGKQ